MEEYSKCRTVPRYACVGTAEMLHNGKLCWGRLGEISAKGCYIETAYPSPAGAVVQLRLTIAGTHLDVGAKVTWSRPQAGMGVSFVFASAEVESKLARIVEDIAETSRSSPEPGGAIVRFKREAAPEILEKVIKQLTEKGVLTMQELIEMVNATP
jgi:PilZ domain